MSDTPEDVSILICGPPGKYPYVTEEGPCGMCGIPITWQEDFEVPADAIRLCMACGLGYMSAHRGEAELCVTEKTKELFEKLSLTHKRETLN